MYRSSEIGCSFHIATVKVVRKYELNANQVSDDSSSYICFSFPLQDFGLAISHMIYLPPALTHGHASGLSFKACPMQLSSASAAVCATIL
jgi:hypothetical protein